MINVNNKGTFTAPIDIVLTFPSLTQFMPALRYLYLLKTSKKQRLSDDFRVLSGGKEKEHWLQWVKFQYNDFITYASLLLWAFIIHIHLTNISSFSGIQNPHPFYNKWLWPRRQHSPFLFSLLIQYQKATYLSSQAAVRRYPAK